MVKHKASFVCTLPAQRQIGVRVWFDTDVEEFYVTVNGESDNESTYYTSEWDDAIGTAQSMFNSLIAQANL